MLLKLWKMIQKDVPKGIVKVVRNHLLSIFVSKCEITYFLCIVPITITIIIILYMYKVAKIQVLN